MNEAALAANLMQCSRFCACLGEQLIFAKSEIGDAQVGEAIQHLFSNPMLNIRIDVFQNDNHCEQCTRFTKAELHDLAGRLGLDEIVFVPCTPSHFYRFHREELLVHSLIKLGHGLPHSVMVDMVVGGKENRLGAGHNHFMKHIDETFINLMNINSLQMWVHLFPLFSEAMRTKNCSYWQQNDDADGNAMPDADNICENGGDFNMRGLMDASVYEICRPGLGPDGEGPNCPRRPNWCAKQRAFLMAITIIMASKL